LGADGDVPERFQHDAGAMQRQRVGGFLVAAQQRAPDVHPQAAARELPVRLFALAEQDAGMLAQVVGCCGRSCQSR
jgi:hypothetical protein